MSNNKYQISHLKKQFGEKLGDIYKCQKVGSEEILFAEKIELSEINKDQQKTYEFILSSLKQCSHPNVLKVFNVVKKNGESYLITEQFDSTLAEYLEEKKKNMQLLQEEQIEEIIYQIVEGYLHLKNLEIVHGSLFPKNILIKKDNTGKLIFKISQFQRSYCKRHQLSKPQQSLMGSYYQAPEILLEKSQISETSDIFSLAIIFYDLCQFKTLQSNFLSIQSLKHFYQQYKNQQFPLPQEPNYSDSLKQKLLSILVINPAQRNRWEDLKRPIVIRQIASQLEQQKGEDNSMLSDGNFKEQVEYCDDDFEIQYQTIIGEGSEGQVFLAKNKKTGEEVVAKRSKCKISRKQYFQEMKDQKLYHDNIVKLIHYGCNQFEGIIFQEKCDINLKNFMKQIDNDDKIIDFIQQVTRGYLFLLNNAIIHRDLKPENIMVKFIKQKVVYKLIDFGTSRILKENEIATTYVGTPMYQAPEIFNKQEHNHQCDVYSLGLILYEILFKSRIPKNESDFYDIKNFHSELEKTVFKCPQYHNEHLTNLIEKMIVFHPQKRIKWKDILDHQIFQKQQQAQAFSQIFLPIYQYLFSIYQLGSEVIGIIFNQMQYSNSLIFLDMVDMLQKFNKKCILEIKTLQDTKQLKLNNIIFLIDNGFSLWSQSIQFDKIVTQILQFEQILPDIFTLHQNFQHLYKIGKENNLYKFFDLKNQQLLEKLNNIFTTYPIKQIMYYSECEISGKLFLLQA